MGFFDDLVVNVKSAANKVGEETGKLVNTSKLKINVSELKSEIRRHTEDIGKTVVANPAMFAGNPEIAGKLAEIKAAEAKIEELKAEIAANQNKVACTNCGIENSTAASFCHNCGAKLPEPPAPPAQETTVPRDFLQKSIF